MNNLLSDAEQISLFCRLNMNAKRDIPIRSSEMGMLIYLCKTEGDKTPRGIAEFFNVSKAMATNMVTAMAKQGYIEKHVFEKDHRRSLITPTTKARVLVETAYGEYYRTIGLLEERMGGEDFDQMLTLLNRANAILLEDKCNE